MTSRIFCFALLIISFQSFAQDNVGIGTLTPHPSAILDLNANNKGLLMPRVTSVERTAIISPATGLMVYDLTTETFWYFDGIQWVEGVGQPGPQGPAGPQGISGTSGTNGQDGISVTGAVVNGSGNLIITLSNSQTINAGFVVGPQGAQGPSGPQGATGATGATGPAGPQGPTGATGPQGPIGATGATGPAGATGATGPQGLPGPVGCSTANFVVKSNGTSAVCSQIFDNGTNVGIGLTNPTYKLHVAGRLKTDGVNETSDARLKTNIVPVANALQTVQSLNGVFYHWKNEEVKTDANLQLGLIAQEVEKILPQVVATDSEGYKSVQYSVLTALLIEGMKEQQKLIEAQTAKIEWLTSKVVQILNPNTDSAALTDK